MSYMRSYLVREHIFLQRIVLALTLFYQILARYINQKLFLGEREARPQSI